LKLKDRLDDLLDSLFTSARPVEVKEIVDHLRNGDWTALMRQSANMDALLIIAYRIDTSSVRTKDRETVERYVADMKRAILQYRAELKRFATRENKHGTDSIGAMDKYYCRAIEAGRALYSLLTPSSVKFFDYSLGRANG
jgi:hypothetical protein